MSIFHNTSYLTVPTLLYIFQKGVKERWDSKSLTINLSALRLELSLHPLCLAAGTSGVIAVVIFGLYGSANAKWGMSSTFTESPIFDTFWDTISFMLNGIVFFYAGASSVNFFWRSSEVSDSPFNVYAAG